MQNQLIHLISQLNNTGNPMSAIQAMYGNNPVMQRAVQMMQGKNPQEVQQIAMNLARQKGVDLPALLSQLGIK
jgi:hypothetical protein